jgi:hypothetical protein
MWPFTQQRDLFNHRSFTSAKQQMSQELLAIEKKILKLNFKHST